MRARTHRSASSGRGQRPTHVWHPGRINNNQGPCVVCSCRDRRAHRGTLDKQANARTTGMRRVRRRCNKRVQLRPAGVTQERSEGRGAGGGTTTQRVVNAARPRVVSHRIAKWSMKDAADFLLPPYVLLSWGRKPRPVERAGRNLSRGGKSHEPRDR